MSMQDIQMTLIIHEISPLVSLYRKIETVGLGENTQASSIIS